MYGVDLAGLYEIARWQRRLLQSLFLGFAGVVCLVPLYLMAVVPIAASQPEERQGIILAVSVGGLLFLAFLVGIWNLICYFRLAGAVQLGALAILVYVIGIFVPVIGLIMIFYVSNKATKTLQEAGYQVGFLGANLKTIRTDLDNEHDVLVW